MNTNQSEIGPGEPEEAAEMLSSTEHTQQPMSKRQERTLPSLRLGSLVGGWEGVYLHKKCERERHTSSRVLITHAVISFRQHRMGL